MSPDLTKKINMLMYTIFKNAARDSFSDHLANCSISDDEFEEFKEELKKIGITNTYV